MNKTHVHVCAHDINKIISDREGKIYTLMGYDEEII